MGQRRKDLSANQESVGKDSAAARRNLMHSRIEVRPAILKLRDDGEAGGKKKLQGGEEDTSRGRGGGVSSSPCQGLGLYPARSWNQSRYLVLSVGIRWSNLSFPRGCQGPGGSGMDEESGVSRCKLLHLEWTSRISRCGAADSDPASIHEDSSSIPGLPGLAQCVKHPALP